jgi:hypothetical protein
MRFSLTRGGPFHHLLRRAHLLDASGKPRALWLAALVWVPFAIAALGELAVTGRLDPIATDLTVHVRLLVVLPLLVAAENLLETRCATAMRHAHEEHLAHRTSLEAIESRAEHIRDGWVPEALILVLVVAVGQIFLRMWAGVAHGGATPARAWCFLLALPLVQFMLVRWLWRWAVWSYVLARLSRLPLSLDALHPDRAAGLAILADPTDAFAVYTASLASLAAASWWERVENHHLTLQALSPQFISFFVVAVAIACGPLVLFSRQLYRARHRDATAYHGLARAYVDAFRAKWVVTQPSEPVLGTNDLQSLNDLGGAYRTAESTRVFAFGLRTLLTLWFAALIPIVPLLLATAPLTDVAEHLGKMVFGATG